ncbi:MAG: TlpA disulfide reductase family protein [Sphingobium sp.]|nr:TlpA disulfide reductase family protein [Sphingobium sp.]
MIEAGPAANRPPHMLLEADLRVVMSLLLMSAAAMMVGACDRQSAGNAQGNAANASAPAAPSPDEVPASGEKTAPQSENGFSFRIDRSHKGEAAPDFVFTTMDGKDVTLASFKGQPMVVNLWATWCGPCVAEMPTLDAIARAHAGAKLKVLAISQDSQGAEKVTPFLAARKFAALTTYLDPENQFGFKYGTGLLPTTVLYGPDGKETARVVGAMDWEGDQAKALIAELTTKS